MQVLAGDIGGTKSLLAVAEVGPPGVPGGPPQIAILSSKRYESRRFPGLAAVCRAFEVELGKALPEIAAFGVPGPVHNGRTQTTNLPWQLDEKDLAAALDIESVKLVNDFHALALGLPEVKPKDLVSLNPGFRDPRGPVAIIGAGTGLGEAVIAWSGGKREVLSTEGGHCDFAPRDDIEIGLLRFLRTRYPGHVSVERILSGDGLVNLAEALAHMDSRPLPDEIARALRDDRRSAPPLVTSRAANDPICKLSVELFCGIYGAEAGNLALKTLATGGVYVAGGIAPNIIDHMKDGRFKEAFLAKGRMRPLLERIPVQVVLDEHAAVLGAAALAFQSLSARPTLAESPA